MVASKLALTKSSLHKAGWLTLAAIPVITLLFSLVSVFLPASASAAVLAGVSQDDVKNATFNWVNESNITVTINGSAINFFDEGGIQNHSTRDDYYRFISNDTCKPSTIWASSVKPGNVQKVDIYYNVGSPNGNCDHFQGVPNDTFIGQADKADIIYNMNGATIQRIDGAKWYTFNRSSSNPNLYVMPVQGDQKSCMDTIVVTPGSDTATLWELSNKDQGKGKAPTGIGADGCYVSNKTDDVNGPKMTGHLSDNPTYQCPASLFAPFKCSDYKPTNGSFSIHLSGPAPAAPAPGDTSNGSCGADGVDSQGNCKVSDDTINCNSGNMNWFICPVITMAAKAANTLDGFIMNTIDLNVSAIFDRTNVANSASKGYYTAWNSFRIIMTGLLIVAGLFMVASQAIGLEVLDAYTIRKTLPRLFIAVILLSLSWQIMRFGATLSSTLAIDVRELIYAPFSAFHATITSGVGFLSTLGTGALLYLMGFPALTFLLTALILGLIGYLVLIAWQAFFIAVLITSAIWMPARALNNLPGLHKLGKFGEENAIAVILFPVAVSSIIAVCHALAAILIKGDGVNNSGSAAAQVGGIVIWFAAYGSLPFAAQAVGGAAGMITGRITNGSKGILGALSQARRNGLKNTHQRRMAEQQGFFGERGGNLYRRVMRVGTYNSGAFGSMMPGALGRSSRYKYNNFNERMNAAHREGLLKEPGVNEAMMDDDVRGALLAGKKRASDFLIAKGYTKNSDDYRQIMGAAESIGFNSASRLAALQGESTHGKGRNIKALGRIYRAADDSDAMLHTINNVGRETGMDTAGVERLKQTVEYNFGQSSRGDLRQDSLADVLDKKFDTNLIATAGKDAVTRLADEMAARLQAGTSPVPERIKAAAQLLASQESTSRMGEETRAAFVQVMSDPTKGGVNYSSDSPIEVQLATKLLTTAEQTAFDTARQSVETSQGTLQAAQRAVDDEVARAGRASAGTMAALNAARAQVGAARAAYDPLQRRVMNYAREIRGTSSTYSSSIPYGARENP